MEQPDRPDRPVVMGHVVSAFGVRGWLKIRPFTERPGSLLEHRTWWVGKDGIDWRPMVLEEGNVNGVVVVAKLAGIESPEAAARFRQYDIAVDRCDLPPHQEGEYYWSDLIGLDVVNTAGESLGCVDHLMDNGAQSVLVLKGDRERLIPFVPQFVIDVDLARRLITLDWGLDY